MGEDQELEKAAMEYWIDRDRTESVLFEANEVIAGFIKGAEFQKSRKPVGELDVEALRAKVIEHRKAYALDIFVNSEVITAGSSIDSISANMGRHMCDCFLRYIDEVLSTDSDSVSVPRELINRMLDHLISRGGDEYQLRLDIEALSRGGE